MTNITELSKKESRRLKTRLRLSSENFCKNTALHGFAQLYSANRLVWRLFWCLACFGALITSTYQVYSSVCEYIEKPTETMIAHATEQEIYYPSLRLCYWHWYQWVDWDKVKKLGIDKNVVLYSLSILNDVYSTTEFDVNGAKEQLDNMTASMNFTSLSQFYNLISRPIPVKDTAGSNVSKYFRGYDIVYNIQTDSNMFCYVLGGGQLYTYFMERLHEIQRNKHIAFDTLDETFNNVKQVLTEAEYNLYMLAWVKKVSKYRIAEAENVNLTTFAPPISLLIFNNMVKSIDIDIENDAYMITLYAKAYRWLSKKDKKCINGKERLTSDLTCELSCNGTAVAKYCNCIYLDQSWMVSKQLTAEHFCHKSIYVIFMSNNINGSKNMTTFESQSYQIQSCLPDFTEDVNKCRQSCIPSCNTWNYDREVTIKSTSVKLKKYGRKNSVEVLIEYPTGEEVLIMTELTTLTWETFVGNVGGIIGIWTGASILSLVQLFYLCCVVEESDT